MIGEGGMGVVYEAEQAVPRRSVALKAVQPGLVSRATLQRLEREAHILGRLQHPCIAQIYEAGADLPERGLQAFIAMELVDGPPITEWARRRSAGVRERVEILARVCDAVQHAHERRVIHRDLKPSNILVDASNVPKVLDFGVARVFDADVLEGALRTHAGMLVGTLAYMSPEQVSGDPGGIDTRTDVYALGVLLFELLTGRLPHTTTNRSLPEMMLAIRDEPIPRLASIDASLRGDLDAIAAKALEKDRSRRYASAAELAQDLRRHLAGEPILARGDSGFYVLRRQVRKHRLLAITSVVTVLALAIAAVQYGIRARRETRLHAEAVALGEKLDRALRDSDVERARLMGLTGNLGGAEAILWPAQLDSPSARTRWALWELYSRHPCARAIGDVADTSLAMCAGRRDSEIFMSVHDGAIHSLDLATGAVKRIAGGNGELVLTLACDARAGRLWAGEQDGSLRAFDVESAAETQRFQASTAAVWSLACTADFSLAALAGADGRVRLVDLATLALVRDLSGHKGGTRGTAFAVDGRLWTGGEDLHVRVWDPSSGDLVADFTGATQPVSSIAAATTAARLAASSEDGSVTVYDTGDLHVIARFDAQSGSIHSVTGSADGRSWIVAGELRTSVWDVGEDAHRRATFDQTCFMARFSGDGSKVVTGAARGPARIWELDSRPCMTALPPRLRAGAPSGLERGGALATTVDPNGVMEFTQLPSGRPLARTAPIAARPSSFGADELGRQAVIGDQEGNVRAFDVETGSEIWSKSTGSLAVRSLRFSADGRLLLAGMNGGLLIVYDAASGEESLRIDTGLGDVDTAIFDPPAARVLVTHRGHVVSVWTLADRKQVLRLDASSAVASMLLLADGRRLAVAEWLGPFDVWDLATQERVVFSGHSQRVRCFAQSPDGLTLVTGSEDGDVRLWDLASAAPLATFSAGAGPVHDLAFANEPEPGRTLFSLHDDGVVRSWDLKRYDAHIAGNEDYQRRALAARAKR